MASNAQQYIQSILSALSDIQDQVNLDTQLDELKEIDELVWSVRDEILIKSYDEVKFVSGGHFSDGKQVS